VRPYLNFLERVCPIFVENRQTAFSIDIKSQISWKRVRRRTPQVLQTPRTSTGTPLAANVVELNADQIIALQNLAAGEIHLNLIVKENEDTQECLLTLEQHSLAIQNLSPSSTSCTWRITIAGHHRLRNLPPVEAARLRLAQLTAIPEEKRSEDEDYYAKILSRLLAWRNGLEDPPIANDPDHTGIDGALLGVLSAEQLQFQISNPSDR
jgi:hypothetical protein